MSRLERSVIVAAPPERVWEVLADFGAIADWVPLIQHSCLLSGQTERPGTVRRVQIARQTLVERVVTWRPFRELAYDIEGLPPVVGPARTTWRLTPEGNGTTTRVVLSTAIDTGPNPVKVLVARKVLERMALASDLMLTGLTNAVAPGAPTAPAAQEETP
ncbi:MAG: SRPBCC family protein [Acidimicrobiales bacterium]